MKKYNRYQITHIAILMTALAFVGLYSQPSFCDEENYTGYDSIVKELSESRTSVDSAGATDPYDQIRFHAGLSLITSQLSLNLPSSLPDTKTLRGLEARLGIDLFTPHWVAEGAIRTFQPEALGVGEVSLREFDLNVVYHTSPKRSVDFILGGGLAARYLDIRGAYSESFTRRNTTPASIFFAGINAHVTKSLGLGILLSYRTPLVNDTADDGAIDGGLTIAALF
jgi:hypothetical protein